MVQVLKAGQERTGEVRMKGLEAQVEENSEGVRSGKRVMALRAGMEVVYGIKGVWAQRKGR